MGYYAKKSYSDYDFTDLKMAEVFNFLCHTDLSPSADVQSPSFDTVYNSTKAFYSKNFALHNINHVDSNTQGSYSLISPFNLPIIPKKTNSFIGTLIRFNPQAKKSQDPVIFKSIELGHPFKRISPGVYAHEISHSQTEDHENAYFNSLHKEVISIFMEKLVSSEDSSVFFDIERLRLLTLRMSLRRLDSNKARPSDYTYIVSTLLAEDLYHTYQMASDYDKAFIRNLIQKVFDGRKSIEELLDDLDLLFYDKNYLDIIESNLSR